MQNENSQNIYIKHIARWGVAALVLLAVVGGLIWVVRQAPAGDPLRLGESGAAFEHTKGPADASVRLVEYSDFQCPACRAYYPLMKALGEEFPNDLEIVYRHFPLERIHQNANAAGRAAEAAGVQGRFWEMHDWIFERQDEWSKVPDPTNLFAGYAVSIGLDENKFRADMNSQAARDKVQDDLDSGTASLVNSTPTFFLNMEKIQNPRSYEEFRTLILQHIVAP